MQARRSKVTGARIALAVVVVAGLALTSPGPAQAQWFGTHLGPIPPGQIVGSLMRRGFVDVGRPRLNGDVYVVEGVNARGMRVRLVIDAFEGDVISRIRLDEPLLPPRDVGRERTARLDPFRFDPPEEMEEEFLPRVPGRGAGRGQVERRELLPLTEPRRGEVARPGLEPRRAAPDASRQKERQAKRAEPPTGAPATPSVPAQDSAETPQEKPSTTAAVPATAPKPPEAAPVKAPAAAPAPEAKQAEARWKEPSGPRTVRVIEGVTPVAPKPADAPNPVTVPVAPLE